MRIFRLDYFFWVLLLGTGIGWYLSGTREGWMASFLLLLGLYLILTFFIRAIYLQSIKENQKITELSNIKIAQYDTSMWMQGRGTIVTYNPLGKITDKGAEVGRLYTFTVEIEGTDGGRWRTLIKNYNMPVSHVTSFGKYTEVMVLYNPENKYNELIFDPDQKPWHFEK